MEKLDVQGIECCFVPTTKKLDDSGNFNRVIIKKFIDYCMQIGMSKKRLMKYVYTLLGISRMLGKFFLLQLL